MQHGACQLVESRFLFWGEAQNVNGTLALKEQRVTRLAPVTEGSTLHLSLGYTHICSQQLLCIINAGHQDFTLADEGVVIRVGCNKQQL